MRSRPFLACFATAIAVAALVGHPRPLHASTLEIVRTIPPASPADAPSWELVRDPRATGMAAERFRLSLQYYPPIGWKFSNLKIRIDRAVPETFPAKIMGCGADGFPGAGGTLGDLVLKIREAPGQQPVLMVLANRDFYAHPCRLEATFPGGVSIAVGDVTGAPVAPPTVLDIGDAGRTGLAAGSLTVVLRRLANPRSPSEGEIHYTITLASAPAVDTASPRSYPATATGCSAAGAESETIFHGGLTGRSEARPDGSLRIELVARAAPGCRITASIPARSG